MTATIEEMKVILKTGCYRDFHITAMADSSTTTKHESPEKPLTTGTFL
ncbi:hypothetical protein MTBBW1_180030 [Desulfamplus magnetovallimortis]|uniref:Uncharacterized protein n=1 Tax=Desulfamplus magnetovallimortis TaxID=1246637 RepID=A0A1W1HAG4_9BACT|nr:hypothetical protein MTBBW1_180030 [Desulfamplus magnetovallimortis]